MLTVPKVLSLSDQAASLQATITASQLHSDRQIGLGSSGIENQGLPKFGGHLSFQLLKSYAPHHCGAAEALTDF